MLLTRKSIPRRAFLRGTGAALALPLLDAMTPALCAEPKRPTRLGFINVPNGIMDLKNEWSPKETGPLGEMTRILEPLANFRDRMLLIAGLDSNQARGLNFEVAGDHPRAATAWLTGAHAKMTAGADLHAGISVDQIAAREFGKETQVASLEIGLESPEVVGACETEYGCAYYNTISWRNESSPLPMENRPRAVFERLFGDIGTTDPEVLAALRQEEHSILDAVTDDIRAMRASLGGADRAKMEQYLEAIRDVERRMQLSERQADREVPQVDVPAGAPQVFSDYFKLMADLMVLAWQTDMTRVVTFMMGHEMSGRAYPELDSAAPITPIRITRTMPTRSRGPSRSTPSTPRCCLIISAGCAPRRTATDHCSITRSSFTVQR